MKHFFLTLLLVTLCATGYGQTIKALGYNTTNNTIVGLTNNQRLAFEHIALTAGTATVPSLTLAFSNNVFGAFASTAFGVGPYLGFSVDGNRRFYISTNTIRAELPISFSAGNDSATRTNLGLGATWLTNDNVTNFRTAIGLGATNDVTFNSVAVTNSAATRTNLGLPLPALTNTSNVTMMRSLAGSTNTNEPFSGVIQVQDSGPFNDTIQITISNGIIVKVEL
jgi:hypothetical protein